jgi:hypothetical protein
MKKVIFALLAFFVAIQAFRPALDNQNPSLTEQDISKVSSVPSEVQTLIKNACYDCHSNSTNYPWYSKIQPFALIVEHHVEDGKKHLNFSEFGKYPPKKADHKLEELIEVVSEKEMPMTPYTWMHPEAKLTEDQRKQLIDWAKAVRSTIQVPKDENAKQAPEGQNAPEATQPTTQPTQDADHKHEEDADHKHEETAH